MTYEIDEHFFSANALVCACKHTARGGFGEMNTSFQQMLSSVPANIQQEVDLEIALSNRINDLMTERGLSKLEFANALGKRPSEVTKWLSGQHNFTIRTISLLSAFFGKSIIQVK